MDVKGEEVARGEKEANGIEGEEVELRVAKNAGEEEGCPEGLEEADAAEFKLAVGEETPEVVTVSPVVLVGK